VVDNFIIKGLKSGSRSHQIYRKTSLQLIEKDKPFSAYTNFN